MWTLVLLAHVGNINDAEIRLLRGFTSEAACEIAGELARAKVPARIQLTYLCLPATRVR